MCRKPVGLGANRVRTLMNLGAGLHRNRLADERIGFTLGGFAPGVNRLRGTVSAGAAAGPSLRGRAAAARRLTPRPARVSSAWNVWTLQYDAQPVRADATAASATSASSAVRVVDVEFLVAERLEHLEHLAPGREHSPAGLLVFGHGLHELHLRAGVFAFAGGGVDESSSAADLPGVGGAGRLGVARRLTHSSGLPSPWGSALRRGFGKRPPRRRGPSGCSSDPCGGTPDLKPPAPLRADGSTLEKRRRPPCLPGGSSP